MCADFRNVDNQNRLGPSEFGKQTKTEGAGIRRIRLDDQIVAPQEIAVSGFHPRGGGDLADWTDGNATILVPAETSLVALNILALPKGWLVMAGGG